MAPPQNSRSFLSVRWQPHLLPAQSDWRLRLKPHNQHLVQESDDILFNDKIEATLVRLLDENKENKGEMPLAEALEYAKSKVFLVTLTAVAPVPKIHLTRSVCMPSDGPTYDHCQRRRRTPSNNAMCVVNNNLLPTRNWIWLLSGSRAMAVQFAE